MRCKWGIPLSPTRSKRVLFAGIGLGLIAVLILLREPLAYIFFQQAIEAKKQWQLHQAVRFLDWSLVLNPGRLETRFQKGICHQLTGDFISSQKQFDLLLRSGIADARLRADVLNAIAVNQFHSNEPDRGIESHKEALRLAMELEDRRIEAQALTGWGRILYHFKGDSTKALEYFHQAFQIGRDLHDQKIQADALRHLGVVYFWHKGELERPLSGYFNPALDLYKHIHDVGGAAITLSNISLIHSVNGDLFQFQKFQRESMEIRLRIGDMAGLSDSYLQFGNFYSELNPAKATDYYLKSMDLSRKIGYRLTEHEALSLLANSYFRRGDFDKSIDLLHTLTQQEKDNPMLLKYVLAGLARSHLRKGEPVTALQSAGQALEVARQAPDPRFAMGMQLINAEIYMNLADFSSARESVRNAEMLRQIHPSKYFPLEVQIRLLSADLMEHQNRPAEALMQLLEAAEIESQLYDSANNAFFQVQDRRLYDRLFPLLFEKLRDNDTAFRLLEQLRYRSFRNLMVRVSDRGTRAPAPTAQMEELLKRVEELTSKLKEEDRPEWRKELRKTYHEYEDLVLKSELEDTQYHLVHRVLPASLQEVQRRLDPDVALIEYVLADDRLYVLAVTSARVESMALPVTEKHLDTKVRLFRSLIFENTNEREAAWRPVSDDLRKILIRPLEEAGMLRGIKRLALVPCSPLHDLPFAALSREEKGDPVYLIEDYTIFHVPSATYLTFAPQGSTEKVFGRMISFGLNQTGDPQLPVLQFAVEEAEKVAHILGGEARLNQQASETELKKQADRFRLIHLATHAVSEPQMPLLSRLKLHGTSQDDGNLTIREILNLRLDADLVTLGACRTGQSFSRSGEEHLDTDRIGLIEAFLYSGARNVLASLFPIQDQTTTLFMTTFYKNLKLADIDEALARTQRAMIRGELSSSRDNSRFQLSHPRYWAPFILVGASDRQE